MTLTTNDGQSMPEPCERFEGRMQLSAKFIAHLTACDACLKVIAQLNRDSEMELAPLKVEHPPS
jgi:hypothetical protein